MGWKEDGLLTAATTLSFCTPVPTAALKLEYLVCEKILSDTGKPLPLLSKFLAVPDVSVMMTLKAEIAVFAEISESKP